MPERFEDYLRQVSDQIRWERAIPVLTNELKTHLLEDKDSCILSGTVMAPYLPGAVMVGLCSLVTLYDAIRKDWFGISRRAAYGMLTGIVLTAGGFGCLLFGGSFVQILQNALHPELDAAGKGYMGVAVREAIRNANYWGTGHSP